MASEASLETCLPAPVADHSRLLPHLIAMLQVQATWLWGLAKGSNVSNAAPTDTAHISINMDNQQPMKNAKTGLADPQLWDVLIEHVMPQLPTSLALLGSLRGVCSSTRDLLDSQIVAEAWSCATWKQLYNLPPSTCPHHPQELQPAGHSPCSQCIQAQLRERAASLQRLGTDYQVTQWPRWFPNYKHTSFVKWSPCSRWVAVCKDNHNVWSWHQPKDCLGGPKLLPTWAIEVLDTVHGQRTTIASGVKRKQKDSDEYVSDLEWIPAAPDQPNQHPWIVYMLAGSGRMICRQVVTNVAFEAPFGENDQCCQQFALGIAVGTAGSRAVLQSPGSVATWSPWSSVVTLHQLPSLHAHAFLSKCSRHQATARAVNFSPDAEKLAILWSLGHENGLLVVYDAQTGQTMASLGAPASASSPG